MNSFSLFDPTNWHVATLKPYELRWRVRPYLNAFLSASVISFIRLIFDAFLEQGLEQNFCLRTNCVKGFWQSEHSFFSWEGLTTWDSLCFGLLLDSLNQTFFPSICFQGISISFSKVHAIEVLAAEELFESGRDVVILALDLCPALVFDAFKAIRPHMDFWF